MSRKELQTRLAQAARKRCDLAMYRSGRRRWVTKTRVRGVTPGKFFFAPNDLPRLTALLRERLPREAEEIVREADEICRHRFRLLGYTDLDYGREIDWHLDAVHDKRAPLKPWFKTRFLEFAEVGDHKVVWELNRHQHLITLAKAWGLTGDKRYVTELVGQWYAWQRANPYPLGINWASSLEVAFRSLAWLWVRELTAGCRDVPAEFEQDFLQALGLNGRYIDRYLSIYFSPNTHLLGEAVALFFIGTLCPTFSTARRWQRRGWGVLLREARRQVRADGVYFEQALYYHVYALDFFLHARQLAARNQMEIPSEYDQTVVRMLEVLQALSQTGMPESFGDDDGGRVFNPRRNRAEHMTDPLAVGAGIYNRGEFKEIAPLTEEALWLLGTEGIRTLDGLPSRRTPPEAKSLSASGIYLMTDSGAHNQRIMCDAGPQGAGRSGHGHADALSVTMAREGRRWLIDPGTSSYLMVGGERDLFRGTGAHNTLRVDGLDQAVPEGPFAWSAIPEVRAERWLAGSTFALLEASHTGYCRLPDPVVHRRSVFYLYDGFWLVRDLAVGRERHQLEIFWHFAADVVVKNGPQGVVAMQNGASSASGCEHLARLALMPAFDSNWRLDLSSGSVSPAYGVKTAAPVVRLSAATQLPADCACLLIPLAGSESLGRFVRLTSGGQSASGYRFDCDGTAHCFFFAPPGRAWRAAAWTSDASFLYCRLKGGRLAHLILCGGRFAEFQGNRLVDHEQVVERFEWLKKEGVIRTFSSHEAVVNSIKEGLLEFV
jgi:Heparinase II/III-like protein/Heparinase II/III N-terminus